MSTHCNRYPACGCGPDIGTKCNFPEELMIYRNELGYPLKQKDGDIDWEKTAEEKEAMRSKFERIERGGASTKPHRKHATNYTPPKKRHRKK